MILLDRFAERHYRAVPPTHGIEYTLFEKYAGPLKPVPTIETFTSGVKFIDCKRQALSLKIEH